MSAAAAAAAAVAAAAAALQVRRRRVAALSSARSLSLRPPVAGGGASESDGAVASRARSQRPDPHDLSRHTAWVRTFHSESSRPRRGDDRVPDSEQCADNLNPAGAGARRAGQCHPRVWRSCALLSESHGPPYILGGCENQTTALYLGRYRHLLCRPIWRNLEMRNRDRPLRKTETRTG
jgi:hypothetical protein